MDGTDFRNAGYEEDAKLAIESGESIYVFRPIHGGGEVQPYQEYNFSCRKQALLKIMKRVTNSALVTLFENLKLLSTRRAFNVLKYSFC